MTDEAGSTGFSLYRSLVAAGIECQAVTRAITQAVARRDRLDKVIEDLAAHSDFTPPRTRETR